MFAPWRSQNPVRKTWVSDYWKIIHSSTLEDDNIRKFHPKSIHTWEY